MLSIVMVELSLSKVTLSVLATVTLIEPPLMTKLWSVERYVISGFVPTIWALWASLFFI